MEIKTKYDESETSVPTEIMECVLYEGYLKKWTNYYNGWQDRYVVLSKGRLSYFKDKDDTDTSCKGSLNITKIRIATNDYDECRFDVKAGKANYFFRADTVASRDQWITQIETIKENLSNGTNQESDNLSRIGSIASLISCSSYKSSEGDMDDEFKENALNLTTSIDELEMFKNQIYTYIETMQNVYDTYSNVFGVPEVGINLSSSDEDDDGVITNGILSNIFANKKKLKNNKSSKKTSISSTSKESNSNEKKLVSCKDCTNCQQIDKIKSLKVDFITQARGFRSVASGLLSTMTHCVEAINAAHDNYKDAINKERNKKYRLAEKYKNLRSKDKDVPMLKSGPDFVEGPHSKIESDEFFDAFETAYEIETGRIKLEMDRVNAQLNYLQSDSNYHRINFESESMIKSHRFSAQVIKEFDDAEKFLTEPIGNDGAWELSSDDGPTKVYKKTLEIENIVVDPHRVISIYEGVTAQEVALYFWDPSLRLGWDVNVDEINVLEWFDDNSCVVHQLHKHIWPAARRDCCFYSEIRCNRNSTKLGECLLNIMTEENSKDDIPTNATLIGPSWMVVNFSVDHEKAIGENCVRALANVGLLCQTFSRKSKDINPNTLTRKDIFTRLHYFASINPGGWLPASAVRSVARREFPKFIQNLGRNITISVSKNPPQQFL